MGIKDCQIELDNPWNTYYAGQTVNGKVTFTFDSPKKVRGILIKFLGEAETHWKHTETKTDREGKRFETTENMIGQETYFTIQYYLLGGKNGNEIELEATSHSYPFSCALPATIPSSFEGEWGFVRYTIKVTLERAWKFDQDLKMAFTVISPLDLNQNPRVKEPFKLQLEKTFCCFCCTSGPLSLIVHIPVTGFVSGQQIPLTIECDNASNVDVDTIEVKMRKLTAFHVLIPRRETKNRRDAITKIGVGPVTAGKSQTWSQTIHIPPLPPSNLDNCGIIDVDYDIKVEAVVSGLHCNLGGTIPIVLGTVPLASFQPSPPYTDNPVVNRDLSAMPTLPVNPASPPYGTFGTLGWNIPTGGSAPYPNIRILIKFLGEAETNWKHTETKTDQDGKQYEDTTNLTGHEEYFQIQYYLLGGKNSNEIELEATSHSYPFTCALPPTLPSSFEGEWGFVRYTIKVTLDRPWKFDQDMKMAFTVISPVDLNQNPRVKEPFKLQLEKTFCCFCCASGPLSLIVHIPVTGFVSGQTIPLTIECDNASNVDVDSIELKMRKLTAFHVLNPRRETKNKKDIITKIGIGPVTAGNSQTWSQTIQIPPLPPSNLVNCGIIDVDYDIKVEAVVSGPHANLDGNIPIVLGTVPLESFQPPPPYTDNPVVNQDLSTMPTQPVSPASPPNGSGGALGWNISTGGNAPYPNIPPPTFEEATYKPPTISTKNDNQFTRFVGPAEFAPRYPTYAFAPSAPPADL